jgi:UDP-N-acetylglucosamine 2-epimerase
VIKNLIVFETRPEAIKMVPLARAFQKENYIFDTCVLGVVHKGFKVLDIKKLQKEINLVYDVKCFWEIKVDGRL